MALIRLLEAARHHEDEPHQIAAWNTLQERISEEALIEFQETYRAALGGGAPANPYHVIEPLLVLIREGESSGSYEAANTGQAGGRPWQGLTAMTLAEIMDAQAKGKLFAAGAYQIIPEPMKQLAKRASLPLHAPFSKPVQDWLAVVLILGGWKRPKLTSYLLGKGATLNEAHMDVAYEWACLQGPDGRGMYDDDTAGNRARISAAKIRSALMACKEAIAGRSVRMLGLKPPAIAAPPPPPPPPKVGVNILDIAGSEEAGMQGPKAKLTLKEGEHYLLVNDRDEDCECYDWQGKLLWKVPALAKGQGSDPRAHRGDTPPGLYRLGKLYADYEEDPSPRKTAERQSYGWFSFDMEELEGQEKAAGRAGIMIHGGGSACGWPGAWAQRQKLHPTFGCVRMHNIDLRDKVLPIYRSGSVYVGVYQ